MFTGAALNPPTATLYCIPGGIEGVKRTLAHMVDLVRTYKTDVNVLTQAGALVKPCGANGNANGKDYRCMAAALQRFVRDEIVYVPDVEGVETLRTPVQTLKFAVGDCDDKATLMAALAAAVGFATRFIAIAVRDQPNFTHVSAQVRLGSSYINAETIVPGAELGWFPPDATDGMLAHV